VKANQMYEELRALVGSRRKVQLTRARPTERLKRRSREPTEQDPVGKSTSYRTASSYWAALGASMLPRSSTHVLPRAAGDAPSSHAAPFNDVYVEKVLSRARSQMAAWPEILALAVQAGLRQLRRERILGAFLRGEMTRDEAVEAAGIDWVELAERQHRAAKEDLSWALGD
jgi:hypothetical protein